METVTLKLPQETLSALRQIARSEDVTPGVIIRGAIQRDLRRRARAKKAARPDERLVGPLRALLAEDFAFARTWQDLMIRLRHKGYALREAGGGLIVTDLNGLRICKASDVGNSYRLLLEKFDAPFPGHGSNWRLAQIPKTRPR